MKIPDFGEGGEGSRTTPIGDPDFIFVSINGQLGSNRVSQRELGSVRVCYRSSMI